MALRDLRNSILRGSYTGKEAQAFRNGIVAGIGYAFFGFGVGNALQYAIVSRKSDDLVIGALEVIAGGLLAYAGRKKLFF